MDLQLDLALVASMAVSLAAIVLLGMHTHVFAWRRSVCPACRVDSRACRCRRRA
jgi:hypothetical protein